MNPSTAELKDLIGSQREEAVVTIPNCVTRGVNEAHVRRFGPLHSTVFTSVEQAKRELQNPPKDEFPCYCEDTFVAEALDSRDCVLEVLAEGIEGARRGRDLLFRRSGQNGTRNYTPDFVEGAWVAQGPDEGWLRVGFTQESRASIVVRTLEGEQREVVVRWRGRDVSRVVKDPVRKEDSEPWKTIHKIIGPAIQKAGNSEAQARDFLRQAAQDMQGALFLQHKEILRKLYENVETGLQYRLHQLRLRLLDTPVLMDFRLDVEEMLLDLDEKDNPALSLESALDSIELLDEIRLKKAAELAGIESGKNGDPLRRAFRVAIRKSYKENPRSAVEFDTILGNLEREQLAQLVKDRQTSDRNAAV